MIVAIALGLLGLCVPCVGILAAVAIPGFVGYVRRAKTAEAVANVRAIATGVAAATTRERVVDGVVRFGVLPPGCPRTPELVGPERRAWTGSPCWEELGFVPTDPLYYAYEYAPDPDGRGFAVRARGDLDGDGVESLFELRGTVDPTGEVSFPAEPSVTDELE